jgi:hypothetical protein
MRAYEINEERVSTDDAARFTFVVQIDQGEVRPSVHEIRIECDDERFDANWATIVAQDPSPPPKPRYNPFVQVIREVSQTLRAVRVANENACFWTEEVMTTEVTKASRVGLGGTA